MRYRRGLDAWTLDHDGDDDERRRRQRLLEEECADDGAIAAALGAPLERNESRELDQSILSRVGELVVGTLSPRINRVLPCAPDAAAASTDRSRLEKRCV
jgi:hypothetical protein